MARIYTALGNKDEAFRWLEAGYQEREALMVTLHTESYGPMSCVLTGAYRSCPAVRIFRRKRNGSMVITTPALRSLATYHL